MVAEDGEDGAHEDGGGVGPAPHVHGHGNGGALDGEEAAEHDVKAPLARLRVLCGLESDVVGLETAAREKPCA